MAEDGAAKHAKVRALAAEMGVSQRGATAGHVGCRGAPMIKLSRATPRCGALDHRTVRGSGRVLPGGTAERLLSGSPVPVAVAPNGYASRVPRPTVIGVGFDESPDAQPAVPWAADLTSRGRVFAPGARCSGASCRFGNTGLRWLWNPNGNQVLAKELQSETEISRKLSRRISTLTRTCSGARPREVLVEQLTAA